MQTVSMMCNTSLKPFFTCIMVVQDGTLALITSSQMRAARALLGLDQKTLAELAGVSLPTIQRMEASNGNVRGIVDSLTKVVDALNRAGVDLIGDNVRSESGGRGVRLRESPRARTD
jgi:transcriptional regulator with XRE-family HTH domain